MATSVVSRRRAVVLLAVVASVAGVLAAQTVRAPVAAAAPAYPVVDLATENVTDPLGAVTSTAVGDDAVTCPDPDGGNVRAITGLQGTIASSEVATYLGRLEVSCQPFATPAPRIDTTATPELDALTSDDNPADPRTASVSCNGALVGLGATVAPGVDGDLVTDLQPYCAPLDDNGVAYGSPQPQDWMFRSYGQSVTPVFCSPGSFAIGIRASTSDYLYGLTLVCDAPRYDPAGVAANFPHTASSVTVPTPVGDPVSPSGSEVATCGDGTVAVGLQTASADTGEGSEQLTAVGATCSPFSSPTVPTGVTPTPDTGQLLVPRDPQEFLQGVACDTGSVLTGMSGRVTAIGTGVLSAVSAYCSVLGPDGVPTGTPALQDETGLGEGTPTAPVLCPAGTAVTGFVGLVASTAYGPAPAQLQLICSTFAFAPPAVTPQPSNSSWTTATRLDPTDTTSQALTSPGGALWYRFSVQPSSSVSVSLTGLAQDDDLAVFSDIGQAFTGLTSTADLTRLAAEFAGVDVAPTTFSPTTFSPTTFSPTTFSPTTFSPTTFSPTTFSPTTFSPTTFSPTTFSPTTFSPTTFSPTTFSPDVTPEQYFRAGAFPDEAALAGAYSSAQTRSVLGVSAHDGLTPESLQEQTFNHTGDFYVRVTARNGAVNPQPFSLAVTTTGGPCSVLLSPYASDPTLTGTPGSVGTVVLTDSTRLTGSAADLAALATANTRFATTVGGAALVDVSRSQKVRDLQAQAAANPGCPYAKNLVAQAIRDVVNSYRSTSGTLRYVVIEGNDSVIPFFRYADTAGVAAESGFSPPVTDGSASDASLRNDMVLGQDAYGSATDVTISGVSMPVPDLAVGRLVETPAEIAATLSAYVAKNGAAITPTSTLSTGYDFLAAGAKQVASSFAAADAAGRNDTLITDQGVDRTLTTVGNSPTPTRTWTAADLKSRLFGSRHDVVYLAGHFSGNAALAADFSSAVTTRDLAAAPAANFQNTLVFSAGCHSGYNTVDPDAVAGVTDPLDWAQAFAQKGATLVAGTGYQYGDTDFVRYSNELYVDFARALRVGTGAVAVGTALTQAKHDYLAGQASLDGVDQKSLLEATLFGLPMQGVDFAGGRLAPPAAPTPVATTAVAANPGRTFGLSSATITATAATTATTVPLTGPTGTVNASYLSGPGGAVEVTPAAPTLPLVVQNATAPAGTVLRGVGFRSGTYTDRAGVTPLTGAPATETNTVHGPFVSDVFYPDRLATPNYFDALSGSPSTGATRLLVTPAQYRSDAPGSATDVQRTYSALGFAAYYSGNHATYGANVPAAAAPPSFSGVVADPAADGRSVVVAAHVVGDPAAGIQSAWVTWTDPNATTSPKTWQSVDLVRDAADSTRWSATIALPAGQLAGDVQFLVQAVNGVGVVGADDAAGRYHRVTAANPPVPTATTLALGSAVPGTGSLGGSLPVSATLVGANGAGVAGQPVTFGLGGSSIVALTNGSGVASTTLPITAAAGRGSLTASFAGTPTLSASTAVPRPVTVAKRTTAATLAAVPGGYQLVLTDTTVAGHPVGIPARTVYVVATGSGGAVLGVLPLLTDAAGRATVPASALPAGTTTVTPYFAAARTPTATSATFDETDPSFAPAAATGLRVAPAVAVSVSASAGTPQSASAGAVFATALAALAVDAAGNPVPGVSVTFQVPAGSATTGSATFAGGARTATAVTGSNGIATAPALTAGSQTGPVVATAVLTANPSAPGAAYQLTVTVAGTSARADLAVGVSAPSTAAVGGSVTVTVTVTNRGPSTATRLGTVLAVPWGATVAAVGSGTVIGRQVVLWTSPSLASGSTVTYRVTVAVGRSKGVVLFAAGALSAVPDPDRRTNVALTLTQVR